MTDIRRSATYRALVSCVVRYLQTHRDAVLDRVDRQGWKWDPEASRELEQVDEALTRIGVFDTNARRPQ